MEQIHTTTQLKQTTQAASLPEHVTTSVPSAGEQKVAPAHGTTPTTPWMHGQTQEILHQLQQQTVPIQ